MVYFVWRIIRRLNGICDYFALLCGCVKNRKLGNLVGICSWRDLFPSCINTHHKKKFEFYWRKNRIGLKNNIDWNHFVRNPCLEINSSTSNENSYISENFKDKKKKSFLKYLLLYNTVSFIFYYIQKKNNSHFYIFCYYYDMVIIVIIEEWPYKI